MTRTGVPRRWCSSTSPPGSAPSIESRCSSASASPIERKMPGTSSSTAAAASAIAKRVLHPARRRQVIREAGERRAGPCRELRWRHEQHVAERAADAEAGRDQPHEHAHAAERREPRRRELVRDARERVAAADRRQRQQERGPADDEGLQDAEQAPLRQGRRLQQRGERQRRAAEAGDRPGGQRDEHHDRRPDAAGDRVARPRQADAASASTAGR